MENDVIGLAIAASGPVSGLIGTYVGLENRVILRLNGTYIRRRECELQETNVQQRIDSLAERIRNRDAGSQ